MARTTAELVTALFEEGTVDDGVDLTPYIEASSMVVDRVVATAKDDYGSDYYNNIQLEIIERWLAAHYFSVRSPASVFEGAGKVQSSYESKVDLNLNNTRFGQAALSLDTAGGLARLQQSLLKGGRIKPLVVWLGKERGEA
jgi:hypothetical protein